MPQFGVGPPAPGGDTTTPFGNRRPTTTAPHAVTEARKLKLDYFTKVQRFWDLKIFVELQKVQNLMISF